MISLLKSQEVTVLLVLGLSTLKIVRSVHSKWTTYFGVHEKQQKINKKERIEELSDSSSSKNYRIIIVDYLKGT